MLRTSTGNLSRSLLRSTSQKSVRVSSPCLRASTSSSNSGGGGKILVGAVVGTTGIIGGTIGYAAFDDDFRKMVEDTIPGAKDVMTAVLGEEKNVEKVPPSKMLKKMSETSISGVTRTPEPKAKIEVQPKVDSKSEAVTAMSAVPAPPLEKPAAPKPKPKPEKVDKPAPSQKLDSSSLDKVLSDTIREMKSLASFAVVAGDAAADAIKAHVDLMQNALESSITGHDEKAWNRVFEAASAKSDALKKAQESLEEAKECIKKVANTIEACRKDDSSSSDAALLTAEEDMSMAMKELEKMHGHITARQSEAKLMDEYRDLIEEGRQQFQKEMSAILPNVKLGDPGSKLTDQELNLFITHAYRKVLHLQQELAKQTTLEQKRYQSSLEKTRIEANLAAGESVQSELDNQRRSLEVEHQKRLANLKEELEADLRVQLKRQAAAHVDHISDVLNLQEKELTRKFERQIDESVEQEVLAHKTELSALSGTLNGLKNSLSDRASMDKAALEAQELWLACTTLNDAVKTSESEVRNIKKELAALNAAVNESDDYIKTVIGGIPSEAMARGVCSESSLRDRFYRVERLARQTAMIGEEGGSLFKYFISYIQSHLVLNPSTETLPAKTEEIDINKLSTYDIVWMARGCLERGDLEQAVRYMSLLKGEPKNISRDWLKEARLLLETKQACDALLAHAAAVAVEALPAKK